MAEYVLDIYHVHTLHIYNCKHIQLAVCYDKGSPAIKYARIQYNLQVPAARKQKQIERLAEVGAACWNRGSETVARKDCT